jgi:hypothetical protein
MRDRKYKVLTHEEKEEIFLLYQSKSIAELVRKYGCSTTHMTNLYSVCIYRTKQQLALRERMPENKYWNTEEEILMSLEPNYQASDLKGWELEQYQKL